MKFYTVMGYSKPWDSGIFIVKKRMIYRISRVIEIKWFCHSENVYLEKLLLFIIRNRLGDAAVGNLNYRYH